MDARGGVANHLHHIPSQPPLQRPAVLSVSSTAEERQSNADSTLHVQSHQQQQQQKHTPSHPQQSLAAHQPRRSDADQVDGVGGVLGSAPQTAARQGAQLTLQQRFLAAAGASVVSALVVNPLDVVKTRIQAHGFTGTGADLAAAATPSCLLDKWGFVSCHPVDCRVCDAQPGVAARAAAAEATPSPFALMRRIAHTEGAMALWRGTSASLLMAVPMVGIYLPLYDALEVRLAEGPAGAYAPLAAGASARTLAVLCTSPLELVRTRMQAALHLPARAGALQAGGSVASGATAAAAAARGMWAHVPELQSAGVAGRVAALGTGVGATLARDVPCAAIYWQVTGGVSPGTQLLEPIRSRLLPGQGAPAPARSRVVAANFVAGSAAGAIAAAVTTPLDVVKTRAQLAGGRAPEAAVADGLASETARAASASPAPTDSGRNGGSTTSGTGGGAGSRPGESSSGRTGINGPKSGRATGGSGTIVASLRSIYAEGGVSALFAGVVPRALRAAPACAIVVASYEAIKTLQSAD